MNDLARRVRNTGRIAVALGKRDLRIAWSYRASFVFGYLGVFSGLFIFYFVSKIIGPTDEFQTPEEYFRFAAIGMALAALVETALAAAMESARGEQVQGTLEALATLPVTGLSLGLGWVTLPLVNGILSAAVTVLLAIPFGLAGVDPNWFSVFVALLLSTAVFGSLGMIGAGIVLAFQQGGGIIGLITGGLALVSGTVFPISVFPSWIRWLADISPLRYALDASRGAAINGQSISELHTSLLALVGFLVVLGPIGIVTIEAGMRHARRVGSLGRF
ncbi:MAG: ABC transporter permease [Solirubrobacteraceae bacterium]|nr:ABC transporter permease [Solirubrobacteraceae bacterium]